MGSLGYRVEVCCRRLTWALTLLEIFGLQCPTETVRMPPKKSRYLLPSRPQRCCISPRSATSGCWKQLVTEGHRYFLCLAATSSLRSLLASCDAGTECAGAFTEESSCDL